MADAACRNGKENDQHIPGNTDFRALSEIFVAADGHKADNDVRHAEITKSPGQAGDDGLPVREEVPVIRIGFRECFHGHLALAAVDKTQRKDRRNEKSTEHQQALEKVGPADSAETAHEGIGNDDCSGDVHRDSRINSDDSVEECAAGFDAGGRIDGIGYQKNHSAENLQDFAGGFEAVGQVLRQGDGIIRGNREAAKTGRFKNPAQRIPDGQADGDPGLANAIQIDGGRQTHKYPGAHIRRAG